jgi:phosphoglycolate phosphatase
MEMSIACNICGSREFKDVGQRKGAVCVKCGAYERTRVMKMFLDRCSVKPETSIFHLAPERGLYAYLSGISGNYVTGDIDLERYSHIPSIRKVDLCNKETFSNIGAFDIVIHSHVIEHVPCNYTAVFVHLHKLLRPGGIHLFAVPIYGRAYEEDLGNLSHEAAHHRFGQFDHLRRFSPVDLQQTLGAIFKLPEEYSLLDHFQVEQLIEANIPEDAWNGYTGHSVFCVGRDDLLL